MSRLDELKKQYPELNVTMFDMMTRIDTSKSYKYLPLLCKIFGQKLNPKKCWGDDYLNGISDVQSNLINKGISTDGLNDGQMFYISNYIAEQFSIDTYATLKEFMDYMEKGQVENKDISTYKDLDDVRGAVTLASMKELTKGLEGQVIKEYEYEKWVIEQMKQSVTDLMNTTSWTKDKFEPEERINCVLQIQIKTIPSLGNYTGYIQVQSTRPAFNSNYNSVLFNFQDDNLIFSYSRNTPLLFSANQYRDNLSSILAFYAYFIIGMDYDSYSLKGGSPYFLEAQKVVTNAKESNTAGWRSSEPGKKNRFWLVDNMMQQFYDPLRECNYLYHRQGIDHLYDKKVEAKKQMFEALNKLSPIVLTRPNNVSISRIRKN